MADYSYTDMLRMQEEAAERVRAMKKRAALAMDESEQIKQKSVPLPDDVRHYSMPVEYENRENAQENAPVSCAEKNRYPCRLSEDKDVLIILAVLFVLSSAEKSDYLILLALVYILM